MEGDNTSTPAGGAVTLGMIELNPHFVCVLCFGYFVDATTITECLHTFCKSCIVNFLQTNHHCPYCDALLSRTRPLSSLRMDRVLQSLVYKTVPGLFQTEMRRRIQFYQKHPHPDFEADLEGVQNYVFNPDDSISLSIKYYNFRNADENGHPDANGDFKSCRKKEIPEEESGIPDIHTIRYFRCPATVPVSVLKSLIKTKYRIPEFLRVELLYGEECLLDSWTLMEVAYIFQWNRESPMELTFQVLITRKVKRKRLKLVRKSRVITKSSPQSNGHLDTAKSNGLDASLKIEEPQQKKSKMDTPTPSISSYEQDSRPLTPPETPDTCVETTPDTDCSAGKLSLKIKREICLSPRKSGSKPRCDYSIMTTEDSFMNDTKNFMRNLDLTKKSEDTEEERSERYETESSNTSKNMSNESKLSSGIPFLGEKDDGCGFEEEEDSGDVGGDQDSEAPLEVDTSHETEPEPEADNEGDTELDRMDEIDEEEQGDSAIDVNDMSASEQMDSDGKETDFNVSSESLDMDCGLSNQENKSSDDISEVTNEENITNDDDKNEDSGVLDLSSHARSVRALRKNSDMSETPSPPPSSESEQRSVNAHTLLSSLNNKSVNVSDKLKELLPIGQSLLARGGIPSRPPLPMDWVRPPLVGAPGVPHAAAFRDLVTLSHAAVQLQIAMAHAQAQAQVQAQVQAQTQKIQSQVQTNVLNNLKSSETLSFVNGSGDTLTISPILGSQGNPKPKHSKSTKNKINSVNQNGTVKKSQFNHARNYKGASKFDNMNLKHKSFTNGTSLQTNGSLGHKVNYKNSKDAIIPKATLPNNKHSVSLGKVPSTSLKIPSVQMSSKQNGSKSEKDKKEHDKDTGRTGDPVFKITNQKLIEFVRQQHLNNKLKHNNNNNNNIKSSNNRSDIPNSKSNLNSSSGTSMQNSNANPNLKPVATVSPSPLNPNGKSSNPMTKETPSPGTQNKPSVNTLLTSKPINFLNTSKVLTTPKLPSSTVSKPPISVTLSCPTSTNISSISSKSSEQPLQNIKSSSTTFTSKSLITMSTPSPSSNTLRTTNTHVRQIPNPSRLHQQSENRLSVGMGRIGGIPKKGLSSGSQTEGLSRIESLTRSLHEKVAASAGVANKVGVLNSLAR